MRMPWKKIEIRTSLFRLVLMAQLLVRSASQGATAADWIARLQKQLDSTQTFQCDFVQTIETKNLENEVSKGRLRVAKPSKLRWETSDGSQVQILNNKDFWMVRRSARRPKPTIEHMTNVDQAPTGMALRFLSGKEKLKDIYDARVIEEKPDRVRIGLKQKGKGGEALEMDVRKKDLSFLSLRTSSGDSTTVLQCQDGTFARNLHIDPQLFEVKEP